MFDNTIKFDYELPFLQRGLQGVAAHRFQKRNLLIGKNGAGKTRFLGAVQDVLREEPKLDTTTVILDFSSLHTSAGQIPLDSDLYSILFDGDSANFSNFMSLVADNNGDLIHDLINNQFSMRANNPRRRAKEGLARINSYIREYIGYEIVIEETIEHKPVITKIDADGNPIRHIPYDDLVAEFSPGEMFIFYLCFFLYYMETVKRDKLILLLDEPELHLHPQILIKVIKLLYRSKIVDQLWVASHSLFLVPIFRFCEIFLFDSNTIRPHDSTMYKQVYNDLIGFEDIGLFEMLKSMDSWEYYQFIVECFRSPQPIEKVCKGDEQIKFFLRKVQEKSSTTPLKVLDYGAGKFRLWQCIQMESEIQNINFISYEAFEPYPDQETIEDIKRCYGDNIFPIYKKFDDVPKGFYDVVVLMNVLHEIDILEWQETLQQIYDVLTPDGILLFLEVRTLTLGEQPFGNTGYLILGSDEVNVLFNHAIALEGQDKTNCWVVPRNMLSGVDRVAIKKCLLQLIQSSKNTLSMEFLKKINLVNSGKEVSEKDFSARKYAFWSQQYINAVLALERFEGRIGIHTINSTISQDDSNESIIFPGLKESK